jgi:hypothetical protein
LYVHLWLSSPIDAARKRKCPCRNERIGTFVVFSYKNIDVVFIHHNQIVRITIPMPQARAGGCPSPRYHNTVRSLFRMRNVRMSVQYEFNTIAR